MIVNIEAAHETPLPATQEQKQQRLFMERKRNIAYNVRKLRQSHRESRDAAAYRCNLSSNSIVQAEREKTDIKLSTLIRIAQGYNVSVEELIGGKLL